MSDNLPRPEVLTPEVQIKIVEAIRRGNYLSTACDSVGVTYETFRLWRKRWKDADPDAQKYANFFVAVKKASALAEMDALDLIKMGEKGWQSKGWFLERRFSGRWGRKDKVKADVTSAGQKLEAGVQILLPHNGRDDSPKA